MTTCYTNGNKPPEQAAHGFVHAFPSLCGFRPLNLPVIANTASRQRLP